ncbi:gluconate 2-dehydrogenase [Aliiruegeria haliotis]|uniref:Gluconate 2-dehydrogenase n=1 Tax=Aliiruegeria haliotis TaxID=1280846 RepID=A0A2T0RKU0_9RHOB|nr:D-glycerate dehydrogenase [Aliiruegeria haliotis]PRY21816.1 gluconate 2-dehydrogenase [Aliiruegeria haliotis]
MTKRILISRTLPEAILEEAARLGEVTVRPGRIPLDLGEARQALNDYDGILSMGGDAFGAETFETGPFRCKVIANFGVGYEHIDAPAAKAAGVAVSNTPGAVTDATADIGMTLVLMTCRRAAQGERLVRSGQWEGWRPMELLGMHVTGKTLGIVGMGRIGKAVARRAHFGFDMPIVFYNRSRVEDPGLPATQLDTIEDLMSTADIVVVTVPATPQTRHLIGAAEIAAMKPTGVLVNIARGNVVVEADLIKALQEKRIGGAGLDVYEFEPKVPQALRDLDNAVLLPHMGTSTLEVRTNMGMLCLDNIRAALEGRDLPTPV